MRSPRRWVESGWAVLLTAVVLGPLLLGRGFALIGDMVFVPHQPWKPAWLGLDGSAARAVPADAFVSWLTQLVPGDLVQKGVLAAALLLAALGGRRLLLQVRPEARLLAVLATETLLVWNPFVAERLGIGHWGLLLGYGALPWVLAAALRGSTVGVLLWSALAAIGSPTSGIIAAVGALVVGRRRLTTLGIGLVVNLPWLLPSLLLSRRTSDAGGVTAFAAHADSPLGVLGSLVGLGGIWKDAVVPPERSDLLLAWLAVLLTLAALAALASRRTALLVVLGLGALVVAAFPALGPGADATRWLVGHVPGAGVLRDSQKWLAPFVVVVAAGLGVLVDRLRSPRWSTVVGVVAVVAPLALLPSLGWGLAGRLQPSTYAADWDRVRAVVATDPARTVTLPWSVYRQFDWNGRDAVLDPASRYLPGDVVTSGDLDVGSGRVVRADDPVSAAVGRIVADPSTAASRLRLLGVRWVLVEKPTDGRSVAVPRGRTAYDGPTLHLFDLGTPTAVPPGLSATRVHLVVAGDVLAALLVLGVAGGAVLGARSRTVRRAS